MPATGVSARHDRHAIEAPLAAGDFSLVAAGVLLIVYVLGLRSSAQQILINVLTNAVMFTGKGTCVTLVLPDRCVMREHQAVAAAR